MQKSIYKRAPGTTIMSTYRIDLVCKNVNKNIFITKSIRKYDAMDS